MEQQPQYDAKRTQYEAGIRNARGQAAMMERGRANTALAWAGEWKHVPAELKKKATAALLAERATLCAELGVSGATAIECWDQIKAADTATPENSVEISTKLRRIAAIDGALAKRTDVPAEACAPADESGPAEPLVDRWLAARAELAEIERAEHPDITDGYGRTWVWKRGDLYTHDGTLAFPERMIDGLALPSPELADNPNYAKLCGTCRQHWPAVLAEPYTFEPFTTDPDSTDSTACRVSRTCDGKRLGTVSRVERLEGSMAWMAVPPDAVLGDGRIHHADTQAEAAAYLDALNRVEATVYKVGQIISYWSNGEVASGTITNMYGRLIRVDGSVGVRRSRIALATAHTALAARSR